MIKYLRHPQMNGIKAHDHSHSCEVPHGEMSDFADHARRASPWGVVDYKGSI